jgi:hypothetical protein
MAKLAGTGWDIAGGERLGDGSAVANGAEDILNGAGIGVAHAHGL